MYILMTACFQYEFLGAHTEIIALYGLCAQWTTCTLEISEKCDKQGRK